MIAVTIGINPLYKVLASVSAKCIQEMMGLDTIILTEKELQKFNVSHPAALKLKLFEIIPDDNILFFDADWFCINRWNPYVYQDNEDIIACHDFILTDDWSEQYSDKTIQDPVKYFNDELLLSHRKNLRQDYIAEIEEFISATNSFSKWINTGFWIANKNNHEKWLKDSLTFYLETPGHHPQYYEQPAMNKARVKSDISVKFLSRKFNTLVATRTKFPNFLIGLHVKTKHNEIFSDLVMQKKIVTASQVKEHFCNL